MARMQKNLKKHLSAKKNFEQNEKVNKIHKKNPTRHGT
jgi:hypothetical protein